jgi:hypothetical protein
MVIILIQWRVSALRKRRNSKKQENVKQISHAKNRFDCKVRDFPLFVRECAVVLQKTQGFKLKLFQIAPKMYYHNPDYLKNPKNPSPPL